ncbi:MAG TPA: TauD/TfdA family dioxygenase [Rhizomicrobium sp.]
MKVSRIAGALGAEISGIELSADLSPATVAELRQIWLEHLVLFFHDQNLPPARLLALARRFGEPMDYPFLKGLDDFPQVTTVAKLEHETVNFGGIWHSDTTYLPQPPSATLLIAREVPPQGGDTLFANQYLAYETLSAGLRRLLEGLHAVSSSANADASKTREDRIRESGKNDVAEEFTTTHPVLRTHPETGRKSLYVNPAHTVRFEGMTDEESAPLLQLLFRHQVRAEFTCRFSWRIGSLALWDNRCALHNPVNDYQGYRRIMHRITLKGDVPC